MRSKTKKLIWLAPIAAVIAAIGALAIFAVQTPGGASADELPGAPQKLTVKAADGNTGRTTLVLNWEAPASGAPDKYRIDVSKNNMKFTFLTEVAGTATTHSHVVRPRGADNMGKAGWKRYYRVYAVNSHGSGEVSSSESAATTAQAEPGEVGSVTFSSSDPTQIKVNWATPDDGGSDILGYCIRAWPTDSDGTDGDDADQIAANDIAVLSTTTCLGKFQSDGPDAYPTGDNGGLKGSNYRGTADTSPNNRNGGIIITDATLTEYTHMSLRAKQKWSYEVVGFNRHGHSKTTSGVVNGAAASPKRPTYPGSLMGRQDASRAENGTLHTTGEDSNVVNLYWTAPSDGGQDITRYEVEISDTSNHWPSQAFLTADDNNDDTLDNVPTGVLGGGTPTKAAAGTAGNGQLVPDPADTTGDQANVAVVWIGASAQPLMAYQLRHTYTGSESDRDSDTARTYEAKLYYRVRTVAGTGANEMKSPWSSGMGVSVTNVVGNDSQGTALPIFTPPVAAPMLDADANDTLPNSSDTSDATTASDDEDGSTGGGDGGPDDDLVPGEIKLTISGEVTGADSYRVDVSDNGGETWTTSHEFTLPINRSDYDHRNLKPEKRLHFRFFAKDGSLLGLGSNVVSDYAGNTDRPGNVRNLVAARHSTDGAGKINLSWDAPTSDGGAAIEQYCILANLLGDNDALPSGVTTRNSIFTKDYAANANGGAATAITANCTRLGESDAKMKDGVMAIAVDLSEDSHVFQVDHDTTMVTFTGLEQKTRWQFEVFALNKASDSDVNNNGRDADTSGVNDDAAEADEDGGRHALSANSDQKKTGTGAAAKPMAPQRLTAQLAKDTDPDAIAGGAGNQGVLILWNPPADPLGAPVLSYKIDRKVNDGEFETEVATHPVGLTHWVDTDELGATETRTYRVSATNAVGTGTEMATVMIPYPAAGHPHSPIPVLTATAGTGSVELSWTAGDGAMSYTVAGIKKDMSGGFTWQQGVTGTSFTVPNQEAGVAYYFAVAACRDAGCTEGNYDWSNIVEATPN